MMEPAWWENVPRFEPPRWLRDPHAQTLLGRYLGPPPAPIRSFYHELDLRDGDRICVLETPGRGGGSARLGAVLVHGLAGNAQSDYLKRVAGRLVRLGVRVVRMNLRGTGLGFGLARATYHGGRSDDVRAVVQWLADRLPGIRVAVIGFSLGGNLALKLGCEAKDQPLAGLDCVLAASAPLDLGACSRYLQRSGGRLYEQHFLRLLMQEVRLRELRYPDLPRANLERVRTLYEFDDRFTAPRGGFGDADHYYREASAGPRLGDLAVDGLLVQALDDPFIPPGDGTGLAVPARLCVDQQKMGGHLGFVSATPWGGTRRWLDARLLAWLIKRWELAELVCDQ